MIDNITDQQDDIPMTPAAFDFVTADMTIKQEIREAARLVLVDGLDRKEARLNTGVNEDSLGKTLGRIKQRKEELLKEYGLEEVTTFALPRDKLGRIENEKFILENLLPQKGRRKK